jgi:hypothetical protein
MIPSSWLYASSIKKLLSWIEGVSTLTAWAESGIAPPADLTLRLDFAGSSWPIDKRHENRTTANARATGE